MFTQWIINVSNVELFIYNLVKHNSSEVLCFLSVEVQLSDSQFYLNASHATCTTRCMSVAMKHEGGGGVLDTNTSVFWSSVDCPDGSLYNKSDEHHPVWQCVWQCAWYCVNKTDVLWLNTGSMLLSVFSSLHTECQLSGSIRNAMLTFKVVRAVIWWYVPTQSAADTKVTWHWRKFTQCCIDEGHPTSTEIWSPVLSMWKLELFHWVE